jgi:chromosome segregation ATPase
MNRLLFVAVIGMMGTMGLGNLAFADGNSRKLCEDSIKLEKARLAELQRTLKWDQEALHNLDETARAREASSARFAARSKELADTAGLLQGADKGSFEEWSKGFAVYAEHDKQIANNLKAAGEEIHKTDERLKSGIDGHTAHIAKTEAYCNGLK